MLTVPNYLYYFILPYAEGNQESILSPQIFERKTYDFSKWSAWYKKGNKMKMVPKKGVFLKREIREIFNKKVFCKLMILLQ